MMSDEAKIESMRRVHAGGQALGWYEREELFKIIERMRMSEAKHPAVLAVELAGKLAAATAELARLRAELAAAREFVERIEWCEINDSTPDYRTCPECGRSVEHAFSCPLGRFLGRGECVPATAPTTRGEGEP
jgi:hypothetical protein